jgi:Fibronectin type III-like domain
VRHAALQAEHTATCRCRCCTPSAMGCRTRLSSTRACKSHTICRSAARRSTPCLCVCATQVSTLSMICHVLKSLWSFAAYVINMSCACRMQMQPCMCAACTGSTPGDDVVMLYVKPHECPTANRDPATMPHKSLKRYKRVSLQPQQTKLVRLSVAEADLQLHGIPGVKSLRQHSAAGACAGLVHTTLARYQTEYC